MLRKIIFSSLLCSLMIHSAFADTMNENSDREDQSHFLLPTNVMNSQQFLVGPPSNESMLFKYDQELYQLGKKLRNSERGQQAMQEADVSTKNILNIFSSAFGYKLSFDTTPAIAYLVDNMKEDAGGFATASAKRHFQRERPYSYFNEPPCNKEDIKHLDAYKSYPSGHTAIGWSVALILSEINPDNQLAIMRKGYDIGESRVICGYHWNSDVTDGRLVAAALVARLHADESFNEAMKKAKEEFKKIKKQELVISEQ